ncbi:MAG: zinc-binding dehydrogenase [Chloroflexota bacterium]|nr:zinc-binding dehydrogenase [Chloroflexota bacterium]MDE2908611.1 zinc-binding dehydrogenase [Chloroflexota bacterium]
MLMMSAARFHEHGERDVIQVERVPAPQPADDEVRIKVAACALNWLDVGVRRGPQFGALPLPLITGVDVSGVIDDVGAGVKNWRAGDDVTFYSLVTCGDCEFCRAGEVTVCPQHRIIGEHMNGGLAEFVVAPARNLIAKPERLTHVEVAALPVVSMTAWHMLITVARLQAGETVFIPGAGGGVASMAIQIAKYAGAAVIVSTSTPKKMARARDLGADHAVNYREADWVEQVIAYTGGRGVDVAQDLVGAATWSSSLHTLARNGRLVVCGSHSGKNFDLRIPQIYHRQLSILGSNGGTYNELRNCLALASQGALKPVIDRVLPLSEIREGHRILEEHDHFGKVVIQIA